MLPISFLEVIKKNAGKHAEMFTKSIADRLIDEQSDRNLVCITQCSAESLRTAIKIICSVIPISMLENNHDLFSLSVRRNPINFSVEVFPVFSTGAILEQMKKTGLIIDYRIATVDSDDEFQFNGTREKVLHNRSPEPSGDVVGVYLELAMQDNVVCVTTMNPEEIRHASGLWDDKVFGAINVMNKTDAVLHMMIFMRSAKGMLGYLQFSENDIGLCVSNVVNVYTGYFEQYKDFTANKFAMSVKERSKQLCSQPSELEKVLADMPEVKKKPKNTMEWQKNSNVVSLVKKVNKFSDLDFGTW
jgi:hypothetical protein